MFPYVSPIVSPVSLGISHVPLGISPCFLFQILRVINNIINYKTNFYDKSFIIKGFESLKT